MTKPKRIVRLRPLIYKLLEKRAYSCTVTTDQLIDDILTEWVNEHIPHKSKIGESNG